MALDRRKGVPGVIIFDTVTITGGKASAIKTGKTKDGAPYCYFHIREYNNVEWPCLAFDSVAESIIKQRLTGGCEIYLSGTLHPIPKKDDSQERQNPFNIKVKELRLRARPQKYTTAAKPAEGTQETGKKEPEQNKQDGIQFMESLSFSTGLAPGMKLIG